MQIIGFSNYARVLQPDELAGLDWDMVQGTNLHHALMIAGRHLDRHPDFEPVVLVVTDGEPTAHLMRDGAAGFDWPPSPETLELTLAEVDKMTRRGATLNVFMLADDDAAAGVRRGGRPAQRRPGLLPQRRPAGRVRRQRLPARAPRPADRHRLGHPATVRRRRGGA